MKPTDIVQCDGYTMYYFGATEAEQHLLPIGTKFTIVYSPSPYNKNLGWRAIRYRIIMPRIMAHGRLSGKYEVEAQIDLSAEDVEKLLWEAMG